MRSQALGLIAGLALAAPASAQELAADMHAITAQDIGKSIGSVTISQTDGGAAFAARLSGLPAGEHGFHVHAGGDCGPGPNTEGQMTAGMHAGGHWDPQDTKAHLGPQGSGHLGDLPVLVVAADGTATGSVVAPRITDLAALRGKTLMIHAGGDNYSDQPKPLGGGGARIACGVIQ